MAPLPHDLFGAAAASDGTYAYVFGGYSFTRPDVDTAIATTRRRHLDDVGSDAAEGVVASAVYYPPTNKIYVFGGSDRDAAVVFDTDADLRHRNEQLVDGPAMPGPRSQMARGYNPANGKIYLNGGYATAFIDSVSNQTWAYDPAANTFTGLAPSPPIQGGTASGVVNGHLLMAGGRTNPDATLDRLGLRHRDQHVDAAGEHADRRRTSPAASSPRVSSGRSVAGTRSAAR